MVFVHIPKTAGTSLAAGLALALGATRIQHVLGGPGTSGIESTLAPQVSRLLVTRAADFDPGTEFVHGHIPFRIAEEAFPQARFLTILRDPRSRLISHWLFARAHSDSMLRGWGAFSDVVRAARQPLREFLADPRAACLTDNLAVRYLTWPDARAVDSVFLDEVDAAAMRAPADAAVDRLSFVGLMEDPALGARLCDWLDRDLVLPRLNGSRPLPRSLRPDLVAEVTRADELLTARTQLDQRMWDRVVVDRLGVDAAELSDATFAATLARFSRDIIGSPLGFRLNHRLRALAAR